MIITLTANPALDKTIELGEPLAPGAVQRAVASHVQAAGKGVNVSRAIAAAGGATLAVLPGASTDPLVTALAHDQLAHRNLPIAEALRTNTTLTDPDGTTTKINEPGPALDAQQLAELGELVAEAAAGASWLVMAGSLPPGVPAGFYAQLTAKLRAALGAKCPKIAVDTSGAPLLELFAHGQQHIPDLVKPNAEELAQLAGGYSEAALEGSIELAAGCAQQLLDRGAGAVLATLGAQGALLVTKQGAWHGSHTPITPRSTVGAGDSSLAGYLLADAAGASAPERLRNAVAYGAAATQLPGSTIPTESDLTAGAVTVSELTSTQGTES
ncbi:1-phosphofructokinase family hexose kinase [Glutamicibacter nicotianae]|uniref:1-phosphofructokinase family hexose kinase n=1 Tax=Glutamicibacter nicotianae TaxID=37929 RepID=UPI00167FC762|nr:1-phosphofructokinase family hexose kinase [Glutamicibacter nicotianae]